MHAITATLRVGSRSQHIGALLLALVPLAVVACGAGGSVSAGPTITPIPITPPHGTLYAFATNPGTSTAYTTDVYALGLRDGTQTWHTTVNAGVTGAVMSGGMLFVGTGIVGNTLPIDDSLQALNASTGAPLWRVAGIPGGVERPLAVTSDAVIAETTFSPGSQYPTGILTAVRMRDGAQLWNANVYPGSISSATTGDSAIYVISISPPSSGASGLGQTVLSAMSTKDGKSLWHIPLPGTYTTPVLSDGVLYLPTQDPGSGNITAILAVRASDGTVIWTKPSPETGAPVGFIVVGHTIYYSYRSLSDSKRGVVALRAGDGGLAWHTTVAGADPIPIAADANGVYTVGRIKSSGPDGTVPVLDVLDVNSGRTLMTHPLSDSPVYLDPAEIQIQVAQGVLYVAATNYASVAPNPGTQPSKVSAVLAVNTQTGAVFWQHQFNGNAKPSFLIAQV